MPISRQLPPRRVLCRVAASRRSQARELLGSAALVCEGDLQAEHMFAAQGAERIVWEVSRAVPSAEPVPRWLFSAAAGTPLLLLADTSRPAMRAVTSLAARASHLQVALIGHGDVERELRGLTSDPPWRDAEQALIARLVPDVAPLARDTIVLAALAAKRRTTVTQLASTCDVSLGTLGYRFREAGVPTVREVLGLFACAHTLWRLDVLSYTSKQAAAAAGFQGTSALVNYVRRHTGSTPGSLARTTGFHAFLEQVASRVTSSRGDNRRIPTWVAGRPFARGETSYALVKAI